MCHRNRHLLCLYPLVPGKPFINAINMFNTDSPPEPRYPQTRPTSPRTQTRTSNLRIHGSAHRPLHLRLDITARRPLDRLRHRHNDLRRRSLRALPVHLHVPATHLSTVRGEFVRSERPLPLLSGCWLHHLRSSVVRQSWYWGWCVGPRRTDCRRCHWHLGALFLWR